MKLLLALGCLSLNYVLAQIAPVFSPYLIGGAIAFIISAWMEQ